MEWTWHTLEISKELECQQGMWEISHCWNFPPERDFHLPHLRSSAGFPRSSRASPERHQKNEMLGPLRCSSEGASRQDSEAEVESSLNHS